MSCWIKADQGGFRGDGAKLLKLDKKNFDAKLRVTSIIKLSINESWCPLLDLKLQYRWINSPRVEIVDGVHINVKNHVEKSINKEIPSLVREAKDAINCEDFRKEISGVYGTRSFPVNLGGELFHINLAPRKLGLSSLKVTPTEVSTSALLVAILEITEEPIENKLLPLPKLKRISNDVPAISIKAPIRATYDSIENIISNELVGESLNKKTDIGEVSLSILDVEVYPSEGKVAFGLKIKADLPTKIFDTTGYIYVIAAPYLDSNKLQFRDLEFSQALDNDFWKLGIIPLEKIILDEVAKNSKLDLDEQIKMTQESIYKAIDAENDKGRSTVDINELDVNIDQLVVAENSIAIGLDFSAKAQISFQ